MVDARSCCSPPWSTPQALISLLIRRQPAHRCFRWATETYGADGREHRQVPGVGNRRQLAETIRQVLALKQQMPDLATCLPYYLTAAARLLGS